MPTTKSSSARPSAPRRRRRSAGLQGFQCSVSTPLWITRSRRPNTWRLRQCRRWFSHTKTAQSAAQKKGRYTSICANSFALCSLVEW
jgi:hypothetical protein